MKLLNGPIVAGDSISGIRLGMKEAELISIIGTDYSAKKIRGGRIIQTQNASFWVQHKKVTQIGVFGDFGGKFMGCIGIGSTLSDVVREIGPYIEDLDVYKIPQHPGICFELADTEDWDELQTPIESIFVYPVAETE